MSEKHVPLPECIDRLARIEENQNNMKDNHLPHIYDELSGLNDRMRKTQTFFVTQVILFGVATIGILLQVVLAR